MPDQDGARFLSKWQFHWTIGTMVLDNQKYINNFRIVIASLPDREKCVCEIYYNHVEWAEISQEDIEIMIQFYPHPSQNFWEFPIDIALEILQKAKKKFLGN